MCVVSMAEPISFGTHINNGLYRNDQATKSQAAIYQSLPRVPDIYVRPTNTTEASALGIIRVSAGHEHLLGLHVIRVIHVEEAKVGK